MTQLEHAVRTTLAAMADDAGTPGGQATVRRAIERSRRDRRRRAGILAATVTAVVAAVVAAGAVTGPGREEPVAATVESTTENTPAPETAAPGSTPAPEQTVAVTGGTEAECVEAYSPAAVAGRAFAFDGTVTAIGPATSNRPGVELALSAVTFEVHEWFRGGSGDTVTVDMNTLGEGRMLPTTPSYEVGARLLVSGEPRWGGAPLDAPVAWACDFTRPYDALTAAARA